MKNIEQLIKESLENHELPFNEAAWASMSQRLDGSTPTPFYRKWWVAASIGTVLVGSALFFGLQNNSDTSQKNSEVNQTVTLPISNEKSQPVTADISNETASAPGKSTRYEKQQHSTEIQKETQAETTPLNGVTKTTPAETTNNSVAKNIPNSSTNTSTTSTNTPISAELLPALISKTVVCLGDEIEINNPNSTGTVSVMQNGRTQLVKANGSRTITATSEGKIEVISGKQSQTISVMKPQSKLYISVDPTLLYENGIPSIEFDVTGSENNVKWQVEKHPYEVKGGKLIVHPYQGQDIQVTAISKDHNGCEVREEKSVRIDEKYNLQAATGFRPSSGDSRTNRFMPYALIERNVAFDMYVYNTKSGIIIFKTSDASNGWDGKNMNTGELMKVGSTYVWKVTLHKPNPGEPAEYKGNITITE